MNLDVFKEVSGYEELEILLAINCLNDGKRNILEKIFNYRNDSVYCVPTVEGFVWYSRDSLKRIDPPATVEGYFSCSHCKSLTSLEGAPEKIG